MIETTHKNCSFVLFFYATWCAIVSPWKNLFSHFLLEHFNENSLTVETGFQLLQWSITTTIGKRAIAICFRPNWHKQTTERDHCKLQSNQPKQTLISERSLQASAQLAKTKHWWEREIIASFSTIGKSKTIERIYNRKLATTARVNNKIIGKNKCKRWLQVSAQFAKARH